MSWHVRGQEEVRLSIPQHYLTCFKMEKIIPEAYETAITDGSVNYTFRLDRPGDVTILFYLNPQKTGSISDVWRVNDVDFKLTHFIYP